MSSFPSSEERTVASSLLLLNTSPPSLMLSTPKFRSDSSDAVPERRSNSTTHSGQLSISYCSNKSSSSSLTNDSGDSSDKEIKSHSVSFSAILRYNQMKLKHEIMNLVAVVSGDFPFCSIARKIRSKVTWTSSCSGDRKQNAGEAANMLSPVSASGEASSCLSSSSSGISSARSLRYAKRCRGAIVERVAGIGPETAEPLSRPSGSPHLRRRGEAILKLLSCGDSSEVKIRQMLGDSPDTSKALRMLLRVDAVKRSGSGGRYDPYVYTVHIFIIH
ncbi:uncharacterized protein LOC106770087 [Vigna radiata var. radiata]|uniref:Uncharacterized protein LOC106770087 n=1 Tax=Vigna radiata var. radiata TaxID=3916 RepID=A0A3Q0F9L1_VIGRR|nr:uncharacterized protein LOC106770087 [Vigna radiata var. radiata]